MVVVTAAEKGRENVMSEISVKTPKRRKAVIESASLTDQAYQRLEEMIVTLALAPGQVLSEAQLAEDLEIGRTPVREALQRLASEGMITVLPRRGILVAELNPSRQLMLLELRREVERLCATKAAARAGAAERADFLALARDLAAVAESGDEASFIRLDLAFNQAVIAACRNEFAERAMRRIQGLSRRFWFAHFREALDLELCARLHAELAQAIGLGDAEAAGKASDALMDYIVSFTRATV